MIGKKAGGGGGDGGGSYAIDDAIDSGKSISVAAYNSYPVGVAMTEDSLKLFLSGLTGDEMETGTLTDGSDITTLTRDGVALSITTNNPSPNDCYLTNGNTDLFVSNAFGGPGAGIAQYQMSTPGDLSTATHQGNLTGFTQCRGVALSVDGTKIFGSEGGVGLSRVQSAILGTPFDITTAGALTFTDMPGTIFLSAIVFNPEGTRIIGLSKEGAGGQGFLHQWTLSTAWDETTASKDAATVDLNALFGTQLFTGMDFSNDGNQLLLCERAGDKIWQLDL